LADRDKEWDGSAVEKRVRAWAGGADNMNWNKYRRAFFWYDEDAPELFGSYKLGFADVINGRLTAIPRGIFACAVVLKGGRGGVNIPAEDKPKVIAHLNKYYDKMDMESPFKALPGISEPSEDTLDDVEAAELEGKLDGIEAELSHFDTKRAEARIDELLDKINRR